MKNTIYGLLTISFVFLIVPAAAQQSGSAAHFQDDPPVGDGKVLLYEHFESTEPGRVPDGYRKQGDLAVVQGVANTGRRSLRIEAAPNGPRRITAKGKAIRALGGRHWGRLFFKVKTPAPTPSDGVLHSTLVSADGTSPLRNDPIEVRPLDTVMNTEGRYQYIYNVQPRNRAEFARGSDYRFQFDGEWKLAEWFLDHRTQTYRLFINGKEIQDVSFSDGKNRFKESEIPPVFESYSFGWYNYQKAQPGFVAWIDDIALARERIGLRGIKKHMEDR